MQNHKYLFRPFHGFQLSWLITDKDIKKYKDMDPDVHSYLKGQGKYSGVMESMFPYRSKENKCYWNALTGNIPEGDENQ